MKYLKIGEGFRNAPVSSPPIRSASLRIPEREIKGIEKGLSRRSPPRSERKEGEKARTPSGSRRDHPGSVQILFPRRGGIPGLGQRSWTIEIPWDGGMAGDGGCRGTGRNVTRLNSAAKHFREGSETGLDLAEKMRKLPDTFSEIAIMHTRPTGGHTQHFTPSK